LAQETKQKKNTQKASKEKNGMKHMLEKQ